MWTTLSDVGMTTGTCGRQATGLTFTHSTQTPWQRLWVWAHTTNKYYTQQGGWMKSEDDEKKPMTREICFSRAHFSLLNSLCYPSFLQPPFFLTLNKGPISFLFRPCLTAVLLRVPSWSRWEDVHGSRLPTRVSIWPRNFRDNNTIFICVAFSNIWRLPVTQPHQLLTSVPFHRWQHWQGRAALTSPDFGVHMADIKSRLYVGWCCKWNTNLGSIQNAPYWGLGGEKTNTRIS